MQESLSSIGHAYVEACIIARNGRGAGGENFMEYLYCSSSH
jgi:hypothetical protein